MRRAIPIILTVATLVPGAGVLAAVATVPPSAYALPAFEVATDAGPILLTPEELGAERGPEGLQVDPERMDAAIARIREAVHRDPVPGAYELQEDQTVHLNSGEPGVDVDVEATRELLMEALRGSRSNLELPTVTLEAPAATRHAIVVRLGDFRLDLYEGSGLAKQYTVGIGKLDFPTPPGEYYIRQKARNPTWRNPNSSWSRGMPAYIPPGPSNPLGTRALRLDRDAIVIHGTPDPSSVGQRSSHGCVRMYREDVEELFEIVDEGTPVFIIPGD